MEDPQPHRDGTECRQTLIIAKFKDSLLSQLAATNPSISINSDHASMVEHRIRELFTSFHTPTHPTYASMIRNAIKELNEETGSSEEAICEFIQREYKDLPWAHVRILDCHLRKLCNDGEIMCTKNGRYMVMVDGGIGNGEVTECRGSNNSKKGKKRKNKNNGDRDRNFTPESGQDTCNVQASEWHRTGIAEDHTEAQKHQGRMAQAQSKAEEPQNKNVNYDQSQHWNQGSSKAKLDESPMSGDPAPNPLKLPRRGRPPKNQESPKAKLDESPVSGDPAPNPLKLPRRGRPPKNQESPKAKLDENPMSGDLAPNPPKPCRGRPPKFKTVAAPGKSLLPSDDSILNKRKPVTNKMENQQQHGRGRGRPPKLNRNPNQFEEQLQPQDQAQGRVKYPNSGQDDNRSLEQQLWQLQRQAPSQERCSKLESDVDKSCQNQQFLRQVRKRGPGRPPRTSTVKQSQWQQLPTFECQDQNQGLGLERPPNPSSEQTRANWIYSYNHVKFNIDDGAGLLNKSKATSSFSYNPIDVVAGRPTAKID